MAQCSTPNCKAAHDLVKTKTLSVRVQKKIGVSQLLASTPVVFDNFWFFLAGPRDERERGENRDGKRGDRSMVLLYNCLKVDVCLTRLGTWNKAQTVTNSNDSSGDRVFCAKHFKELMTLPTGDPFVKWCATDGFDCARQRKKYNVARSSTTARRGDAYKLGELPPERRHMCKRLGIPPCLGSYRELICSSCVRATERMLKDDHEDERKRPATDAADGTPVKKVLKTARDSPVSPNQRNAARSAIIDSFAEYVAAIKQEAERGTVEGLRIWDILMLSVAPKQGSQSVNAIAQTIGINRKNQSLQQAIELRTAWSDGTLDEVPTALSREKRGNAAITAEQIREISEYFERDDVTRITSRAALIVMCRKTKQRHVVHYRALSVAKMAKRAATIIPYTISTIIRYFPFWIRAERFYDAFCVTHSQMREYVDSFAALWKKLHNACKCKCSVCKAKMCSTKMLTGEPYFWLCQVTDTVS
eukprot:gene9103-2974_t